MSDHLVSQREYDDYLALREKYSEFSNYLIWVFENIYHMTPDDVQVDIAYKLQYERTSRFLLGAQRGLGKTTIGGCFVDWNLIQVPYLTTGILTGKESLAANISKAALDILKASPECYMLLPDENRGDRASNLKWDINYRYKGIDKQPSVTSMGISASLQGQRFKLIIGDDLEQQKNSATPAAREQLLSQIKELSNLANEGDILLFGTYQGLDSVYFQLEELGYQVCLYPGRFPANYDAYDGKLATWIKANDPRVYTYGDGTEGAPTSPKTNSEKSLTKRRIEVGAVNYALNVMLDPTLVQNVLSPLHPSNLVLVTAEGNQLPSVAVWTPQGVVGYTSPHNANLKINKAYYEGSYSEVDRRVGFIDPAGGGTVSKNETAFIVVAQNKKLTIIQKAQGFPGGFQEADLRKVCKAIIDSGLSQVYVEMNFGEGMWTAHCRVILNEMCAAIGIPPIQLIDYRVPNTISKAKRTMNTLEPIIGLHMLGITAQALAEDAESAEKGEYSLLQQMFGLTEAGGLTQDDRIDALGTAVKLLKPQPEEEQPPEKPDDWELEFANSIALARDFERENRTAKARNWGELPFLPKI